MSEQTRQAVDVYLKAANKKPGEFLFTGRRGPERSMTTRQYARVDWRSDTPFLERFREKSKGLFDGKMLFAFALRRRHVSLQHGIMVITQYGAYTVRLAAERRMRSGRLRSRWNGFGRGNVKFRIGAFDKPMSKAQVLVAVFPFIVG